jgi:hypothetical protein
MYKGMPSGSALSHDIHHFVPLLPGDVAEWTDRFWYRCIVSPDFFLFFLKRFLAHLNSVARTASPARITTMAGPGKTSKRPEVR